jgi:hypothetical protein
MAKTENNILINPFVITIIIIILLIIVLFIIRLAIPSFNAGIQLNAKLGKLDGNINLETFNNCSSESDSN